MNAFELYKAAFDPAVDHAEATAQYVQDYADGAFGINVSLDVAEKIAAARRSYKGLDEDGGEYENAYYYKVREPLEEIEL